MSPAQRLQLSLALRSAANLIAEMNDDLVRGREPALTDASELVTVAGEAMTLVFASGAVVETAEIQERTAEEDRAAQVTRRSA